MQEQKRQPQMVEVTSSATRRSSCNGEKTVSGQGFSNHIKTKQRHSLSKRDAASISYWASCDLSKYWKEPNCPLSPYPCSPLGGCSQGSGHTCSFKVRFGAWSLVTLHLAGVHCMLMAVSPCPRGVGILNSQSQPIMESSQIRTSFTQVGTCWRSFWCSLPEVTPKCTAV